MGLSESTTNSYPQHGSVDLHTVASSLLSFVAWLQRAGYSGHDQYDLWATAYGIWSRRMYYRWGRLAAPLVLPVALVDWLAPGARRWLCPPRRYPIADAHYLMGFVHLHRAFGSAAYLSTAVELAEALRRSSIGGFSGPAWGYPFDWQSRSGLCPRNTPLVTTTPYVFDAFVELHNATGVAGYLDDARGIAEFVANDIGDTPSGRGCAAGYAPGDSSQVINASAYRAACLAHAWALFGVPRYRELAEANLRFVIDQQEPSGAWPYAAGPAPEPFVDHMHTCFVLKGLYRAGQVLGDGEALQAVGRGYAYYRANLFYPDGSPRPFARGGARQFRVAELYDCAEALNLALLLRADFDTQPLADRMAAALVHRWQVPAGHFVTRISSGGIRNCVPYHRWGQAQAFRALALYYEGRVRG